MERLEPQKHSLRYATGWVYMKLLKIQIEIEFKLKLKLLVFNESYQTIHSSLNFSSTFKHYKFKKFK